MTTKQLFFAIAGLMVAGVGFVKYYIDAKVKYYIDAKVKYYIDAKVDSIAADGTRLIDYMNLHEGKIARLGNP